jgi:GH18 family chitinase
MSSLLCAAAPGKGPLNMYTSADGEPGLIVAPSIEKKRDNVTPATPGKGLLVKWEQYYMLKPFDKVEYRFVTKDREYLLETTFRNSLKCGVIGNSRNCTDNSPPGEVRASLYPGMQNGGFIWKEIAEDYPNGVEAKIKVKAILNDYQGQWEPQKGYTIEDETNVLKFKVQPNHKVSLALKDENLYTKFEKDSNKNKKVVTYLGNWSVYGRDFRFPHYEQPHYDIIVHAFMGICSKDALSDVEQGLNNKKLGDEFQGAVRFYKKTCSGTNDGMLLSSDSFADLQKDLGEGGNHSAVHTINQKNVKGLFKEYIKIKQNNPNVKINVSIGGWTLSHVFPHLFSKPHLRQNFYKSLGAFLEKWEFIDGIDIDWEKPKNAQEGKQYATLIKEVRAELDKIGQKTGKRYGLSSAVFTPKKDIDLVNYKEVMPHLDHLYAMNYDYHGAFSDELGFNTNLKGINSKENSVEQAMKNFIAAGVPSNKLFIGVAAYGRSVQLGSMDDIESAIPLKGKNTINGNRSGIGSHEFGVLEWYDFYKKFWEPGYGDSASLTPLIKEDVKIGDQLLKDVPKINGFYHITDSVRDSDYFINPERKIIFDMETPRTAYNKAKKVNELDLGGVFFWTLEYDNGLLTNAVHEGLGHKSKADIYDTKDHVKIKGATIDLGNSGGNGNNNDQNNTIKIPEQYEKDILLPSQSKWVKRHHGKVSKNQDIIWTSYQWSGAYKAIQLDEKLLQEAKKKGFTKISIKLSADVLGVAFRHITLNQKGIRWKNHHREDIYRFVLRAFDKNNKLLVDKNSPNTSVLDEGGFWNATPRHDYLEVSVPIETTSIEAGFMGFSAEFWKGFFGPAFKNMKVQYKFER